MIEESATVLVAKPRYPAAERLDLRERIHGVDVPDPYRWLEDAADPRTVAWAAEQDDLFGACRAEWQVRRWRTRLAALAALDEASPPVVRRARVFRTRQRPQEIHPTVLVAEQGAERPLVDPAAVDPSGRTSLDAWRPSLEGDLLAYQLSADGTEDSRLWVMDVATGKTVAGPIDRVRRTPVAWLPGGTHFYYVRRLPPELHPGQEAYHRRVYLHRVGTDPSEDVLVFGEGRDPAQYYWVDVTADGRWLTLSATMGTDPSTDNWLADLTEGSWQEPVLRPVQQGTAARTTVHVAPDTGPGDPIWLRTTAGAARGRIMVATPGTVRAPWRELIAERPGAVLADFAVLTGPELPRLLGLAAWTRHAVGEITVHDLADGTELGKVPLPGTGSVSGFVVPREAAHEAWFTYTDHQTPATVLHFDGRTRQTRPWPSAPARTAGEGVQIRHVEFESRDGTTVRMFVLSPLGRPDRPRPTILTGYGGFGVAMAPMYTVEGLAWVQAGGVYAIACLRGGGEEGEDWHQAGRGENKQNVFDDFEAAADHLVEAGWSSRDRLGIVGGSNGGLLVGAAVTRHPEKYGAVVCASALLDMARYERSGLGPSWRREFGSAADPAEFGVLMAYSPYHHVEPGTAYPPVLFTVAEGDSRVDPWHARKMCAAMQHASSGPAPILFAAVRGVGHGFWARNLAVSALADRLAFLGAHLGLAAPGTDE